MHAARLNQAGRSPERTRVGRRGSPSDLCAANRDDGYLIFTERPESDCWARFELTVFEVFAASLLERGCHQSLAWMWFAIVLSDHNN